MGQKPVERRGWLPTLHVGRRLAVWLVAGLAYTVAVTEFVRLLALPVWSAGSEVAGIIGVGIGTLIAFRNNSANDRWWEARKLWGQLINESRNLTLKARADAAVGADELARFAVLIAAFPHALRLHLRGTSGVAAVPGFTADPSPFPHAPGYIAGQVHESLDRWNREGRLTGPALLILDPHAAALLDVCGGCERIRNTPLASSYRALLRGAISLYVLMAPWSLALEMGWWTVPVLAVALSYLLGTEFTAEAIEEPFGTDGDDLPLESYCATIETFVWAVLGPIPTSD